MINKKQIAELAKRVIRTQRGLQDPQIMHPEREWAWGLLCALVIFFSCAGWSVYVYIENKNISLQEASASETSTTVYRESLVKSALEKFSEREATLQTLLGAVPPPVITPDIVATTTQDTASSTEPVEDIPVEEEVAE